MSIKRILIFASLIGVIFLWQPVSAYVTSLQVTCTDMTVSRGVTNIDDSSKLPSESYDVLGSDGLNHRCTNPDGSLAGQVAVLSAPVNTIHHNGTKVIETPAPVAMPYVPPTVYYGGSTCNDGTHSNSTGRGTCSWHGGVAY